MTRRMVGYESDGSRITGSYHGDEHDYHPVCDVPPECREVAPRYHTDRIRCHANPADCERWHTTVAPSDDITADWPPGTQWVTAQGATIISPEGRKEDPVPEAVPHSPRSSALLEAEALITGDRNNQYGPPTQDFARTAELLRALGYVRLDAEGNATPILASDVAIIIAQVKVSRIMHSRGKRDSWVDLAGYAACGYECAVEEEKADA